MKSVKYPDASLKKFFSLNPAVLFSPFQPAIWWAFYILLPFIALCRGDYDALGSKWNKSMWDNMESKFVCFLRGHLFRNENWCPMPL